MSHIIDPTRKQVLSVELRNRLENGVDLPVLPDIARQLILLRNRPTAEITDLVAVVAKDPVISAQIMRHGRMPIYGYGDRVDSLEEAIQLVLGYDKALHLAMGLSAGKSLKIEKNGPLGARATWSYGLQCAVVSQSLARELPAKDRPGLGLAYLAGLMHDIGFLLFGVLYPQEFSTLNKTVEQYDQIEARELEFHVVGITHDMVGSALLSTWNLPDEVVVAAAEHHFPDYDGKHAIFSKLVYLANQLVHMSDEVKYSERTLAMFEQLGLDEAAVQRVLVTLNEMSSDFELMVEDMVA